MHVGTCIICDIFISNVCTRETRKKYLCCARFNFLLNKNRSAHSGQIYATVESSHMCTVKGQCEGRWRWGGGHGKLQTKPWGRNWNKIRSECADDIQWQRPRVSASAKRNAKLRTEITGSAQRSAQKFYFDISQTHTHWYTHIHRLRAHTIAFTANAKQQNKVAESKSQSRSQSLSQALFTLTAAGHSKCIWKGESPKLSPVCVSASVCECVYVSAVICSLFSYIKWLHAQLNTLHRGRWRGHTEEKRKKRSGGR